jgi:hypothetical protein
MRRVIQHLLILSSAVLFLTGCGTVNFDVPKGQRVKLLTEDDPTTVRVEKKVWYALWGDKPLSENHTAPFIEEYHLTEVKMMTQQDWVDTIINLVVSPLSFSRRTVVIEGNPAKEPVK